MEYLKCPSSHYSKFAINEAINKNQVSVVSLWTREKIVGRKRKEKKRREERATKKRGKRRDKKKRKKKKKIWSSLFYFCTFFFSIKLPILHIFGPS